MKLASAGKTAPWSPWRPASASPAGKELGFSAQLFCLCRHYQACIAFSVCTLPRRYMPPTGLATRCVPLPAGLQELILGENAFTRLPPALAAATALESLDLNRCGSMALAVGEVESVILRRMPRLRTLRLLGVRMQPSMAQLQLAIRHAAPALELQLWTHNPFVW